MPAAPIERAPAKINLTLRVLGRRADGYHDIESLVVFADVADTLAFSLGRALALTVRGPTAQAAGELAENLVLKAARALAERVEGLKLGSFALTKRLPVAAGIGGGSADAAAALRLLARANPLPLDDPRLMAAARATGADVPVCLDPRPRVMRGIGEVLSAPLNLPHLPAVLVNPRVTVPTKDVFAALGLKPGRKIAAEVIGASELAGERDALIEALQPLANDLEAPAGALHLAIGNTIAALRGTVGCRLARMSGSGATCFGLFNSARAAIAAARALRERHPEWWVRATMLG